MARSNALLSLYIFFFISSLAVTSCTFTTTSKKNPVFIKDLSTIQTEFKQVVRCETINLNGKETKSNNKSSSVLEIRIINGDDIPANDLQIKELAKKIGSFFKGSLKDVNEYNSYRILFVTQTTGNGASKSEYIGHEFNSKDL